MNKLTEKELKAIELYRLTKNKAEVGRRVGVSERTIRRLFQRIKDKGFDLEKEEQTEFLPEGYTTGKITSHEIMSEDGNIQKQIWARYSPSQQSLERFIKQIERRVFGKAPKIKAPKFKNTDKSLWLPYGDPHFGMYSWAGETGENYDVEMAADLHFVASKKIIDTFGKVDCIYITPLGDITHSDSRRAVTEKSGHLLDIDGRYWRVVDMTAEVFCRIIDYAAKTAKSVKVIIPPGNHDYHTSGHISRTLAATYSQSKHIHVDTSATKQKYERYGNNLIGLCHGDTEKAAGLAGIMAHDRKSDWGETDYHYWFTGHIHNQKVYEYPSCVVESFNTLSAKDTWTAEHGYRSRRQLTGILIDKELGEIERRIVRFEHLRGLLKTKK